MLTYQDYETYRDAGKAEDFVQKLITQHKADPAYHDARIADSYNAQKNETIIAFARKIFDAQGRKITDDTVSNMRLASNFFSRLNTQRCTYSLGNGITFQADGIKERLGRGADAAVKDAGYFALIHGVSFLYWAYDHMHVFKLTEFAPAWDEETGDLGAGVRFWQLDTDKPLRATLYTQDGYTDFRSDDGSVSGLKAVSEQDLPYRMIAQTTPATSGEVLTAHNYSTLPIVPLWGNNLKQSTLVGMRPTIDAYDIVQSGFANDMQDCAQIYWLINGAGGMTEKDISAFRERLLFRHIAAIRGGNDVSVQPYTQEIPYAARNALLDRLKNQLYLDFGGLDVSTISASAKTATEINAAYQPMDENADDFEYQISEAIQKVLSLQGVKAEDAAPQYKRNRVSNQLEQVQMVMMEAQYLDDDTILNKLPNISPEEVTQILKKKAADDIDRYSGREPPEVAEDEAPE